MIAESRVTDRFSEELRLVSPGSPAVAAEGSDAARVSVHKPEIARKRTEALAMIRPMAPEARRHNARELATARAHRAAEISRRAAAGRRRLVVTSVLVIVAAALWVGVASGAVAWGWAIPVTLLAGGVGYLAVQAMIQDRDADAKARAEIARYDQRLRLFRTEESKISTALIEQPSFDDILTPYEAQHAEGPRVDEDAEPRHAATDAPELFVEMEDEAVGSVRPLRAADDPLPEEGGPEWTPVPVPVPTYTLKAEVHRREIPAFEAEEGPVGRVPMRPTVAAPARGEQVEDEDATMFVLDDVLARRRAAGA